MESFVQQLPTLIGVGIGLAAPYLIAIATERSRWRRGETGFWTERRLQAYAEYAQAVKEYAYVAIRTVELERLN
jgi:hypothetical protein